MNSSRNPDAYTKSDLVEELGANFKIGRRDSVRIVNFVLESIRLASEAGLNVELRNFGSFKLKERKGKIVRNPFYPERGAYVMKPTVKLTFRPCKTFADKISDTAKS